MGNEDLLGLAERCEVLAALDEALRMMRAEELSYRAPLGSLSSKARRMAKSVRQDIAHRLATHQRALEALRASLKDSER